MKMLITKKFTFSASHRLYNEEWDKEKNERVFGKNINLHGHNFVVEVTLSGKLNEETGMIMNIDDLKETLNEIISDFDHKNLNELHHFKKIQPTIENIAKILFNLIKDKLPENVKLYRIKVYESNDFWATFYGEDFEISKKIKFYASHRLFKKDLKEEENIKLFGKCANPHGHEYNLILTFKGEIDKKTGFLIKRDEIEREIEKIKNLLNYKDLNKIKFFKDKNPTGENILIYLKDKIKNKKISKIKIYETDENIFEVEAL
ncbi:MAG: 6-carboxytetrahydropterin synthase [candidate division WOR-3 bacterium]